MNTRTYAAAGAVLVAIIAGVIIYLQNFDAEKISCENIDAARAELQAAYETGVQASVHYPIPIHLQKAYAELGYRAGAFPNAEQAARSILSLPMFPEMTRDQVGIVAQALPEALAAAPRA